MKKYELMFIINSETTEEQREATITSIEEHLKKANVSEFKKDIIGEKKLAYEINKKKVGVYVLFTFEIEALDFKEFEHKLNIKEELLRYMIVKID